MEWINIKDKQPPMFESVLGYMPNAAPFPTVRECYSVGELGFYFPALNGIARITHWAKMPEPPQEDVE